MDPQNGFENGFENLVTRFGIEDVDSPARVYARRAAQLMREHGVSKLERLPAEALEELTKIVEDSAGHKGTAPRFFLDLGKSVAAKAPTTTQENGETGNKNEQAPRGASIAIVPGFIVAVDGDQVRFIHCEPVATYTTRQALAIFNVGAAFLEQETGIVYTTGNRNGQRRVLPKSG